MLQSVFVTRIVRSVSTLISVDVTINARPSYSHLKIENLGAVRHVGFQGRWIATIAGPTLAVS